MGQPDSSSLPAIERLKSLITSELSAKRGIGTRSKDNERDKYCEIVIHPLYAQDFFGVIDRDEITDVAHPPFKKT